MSVIEFLLFFLCVVVLIAGYQMYRLIVFLQNTIDYLSTLVDKPLLRWELYVLLVRAFIESNSK